MTIPITVELKIVETPPGVRGDTATGAQKPAVLETGVTVNVPLFINEGDRTRSTPRNGAYIERVKGGNPAHLFCLQPAGRVCRDSDHR